jgi:hypothetical protein
MYTVYLLSKVGEGNSERTFWNRVGVAFGHNKDGSMNFKLDLFPAVTFQIRENQSDSNEEAPNGHRTGRVDSQRPKNRA